MTPDNSRRFFLLSGGAGLAAGALAACGGKPATNAGKPPPDAKEVTAAEDLMREHGILRRALLVYSSAASRLRKGSPQMLPMDIQRTATLFRTFGEDYHERLIEET